MEPGGWRGGFGRPPAFYLSFVFCPQTHPPQTPRRGGQKQTTVLVTGTIRVENIWIQGSLEGTLTADETVTIHRHAKFLGDITARRLIIEEGGTHQGAFTRLT